jgi:hypothetical protein
MKPINLFLAVLVAIVGMATTGWPGCDGDIDCSGAVDGSDLATFAADFGTTGCGTCADVIALIDELEDRILQLETILSGVSRPDSENIYFDAMNVHIRNGTGNTDQPPITNGLGNLIVGYNEAAAGETPDRTGSHNVVVGWEHSYAGYAGIAVGRKHSIGSRCSSAIGGYDNNADGWYATAVGGTANTATGSWSLASGGRNNVAGSGYSLAAGGGGESVTDGNEALSNYSVVLGGAQNSAGISATNGINAVVSGGAANEATAQFSSISGGEENTTSGAHSSILGGYNNTASGNWTCVSGGQSNAASGDYASISGGNNNSATGNSASVSGGNSNDAVGTVSSVCGGTFTNANNDRDTVVGDTGNVYVDSTVVH